MNLTNAQFFLVTLLIKVGITASIAMVLVKFKLFKDSLSGEITLREKVPITALVFSFFLLGLLSRIFVNYEACDLSLEASFLTGILLGSFCGQLIGVILGLVSAILNGEYLAPLVYLLSGTLGGIIYRYEPKLLRRLDFSPVIFIELFPFSKKLFENRAINVNGLILGLCITLELMRIFISSKFGFLFSLKTDITFLYPLAILVTITCLGISLKIWKNTLVEVLLDEIEPARLTKVIERIKKDGQEKKFERQEIISILENLNRTKKIALRNNNRVILVDSDEISAAFVEDTLIFAYVNGIRYISSYRSLDDLLCDLENKQFLRVHRSCIVNIDKIKEILPMSNSKIELKVDGFANTISVSRNNAKKIREMFRV